MSDTPRTDEADKFVTYTNKLNGKAYATEWVYASFAQDLEIELNETKEQRDEAIRLASLFQALYLRLGKAEDEFYSTLMVKKGAESLANLKGLKHFGEEELEVS